MALKETVQEMTDKDRTEYLDRLRGQNEDGEYADLIRWCFEELEEATVVMLKRLNGIGSDSNALILSGRLQAAEALKAAIFGRLPKEEIDA